MARRGITMPFIGSRRTSVFDSVYEFLRSDAFPLLIGQVIWNELNWQMFRSISLSLIFCFSFFFPFILISVTKTKQSTLHNNNNNNRNVTRKSLVTDDDAKLNGGGLHRGRCHCCWKHERKIHSSLPDISPF